MEKRWFGKRTPLSKMALFIHSKKIMRTLYLFNAPSTSKKTKNVIDFTCWRKTTQCASLTMLGTMAAIPDFWSMMFLFLLGGICVQFPVKRMTRKLENYVFQSLELLARSVHGFSIVLAFWGVVPSIAPLLLPLMEAILHHLGCRKPFK